MTDTGGPHVGGPGARWTFLTNHAHVLLALHRNPDLRQRDIARLVGLTEGGVQRILGDLQAAGYLDVDRVGRRNRYRVDLTGELRHPLDVGRTVGDLLRSFAPDQRSRREAHAG